MKKILALLLAMLMLMMGLAACGETADAPDTPEEDPGPSINYEDYVKPVVDRRVEDLITPEELSAIMTVDVTPVVTTDSSVTYQSENGYYMVTMMMENRTRTEFDAMVADTTVWTPLEGVGEAAWWSTGQTELVAYQSGYALSVSGDHVYYGCVESIMKQLVKSLKEG